MKIKWCMYVYDILVWVHVMSQLASEDGGEENGGKYNNLECLKIMG